MSNEITIIPENEIQVAFKKFDATEIFERLKTEAKSVVFDLSDPKQQTALRSHVAKVRKSKAAFENFGKDLKRQYAEIPKKIDETRRYFEDSCNELIEELLSPLVAIEMAEKERVNAIQSRINEIKLTADDLFSRQSSSAELKVFLAMLQDYKIDAQGFNEFETEAKLLRFETIERLELLIPKTELFEADEIKRAEEVKAKAEAEELERIERIKREAALEAERNAKAALDKAEAEKREMQERFEKSKKESEEKARLAKIEAEENAKKAVEAEKARQAKIEAEELEAERKRQENKAHRKRVGQAALEGFKNIVMSETTGLKLGEMMKDSDIQKIILAIHNGEVPNITINY